MNADWLFCHVPQGVNADWHCGSCRLQLTSAKKSLSAFSRSRRHQIRNVSYYSTHFQYRFMSPPGKFSFDAGSCPTFGGGTVNRAEPYLTAPYRTTLWKRAIKVPVGTSHRMSSSTIASTNRVTFGSPLATADSRQEEGQTGHPYRKYCQMHRHA